MGYLPTKPVVLVLVGEKLSGKEMSARYLARRYNFVSYRFSQILADILRQFKLPVSRVNAASLAGALRDGFGNGVLARIIKRKVKQKKLKRVVIDGLRHPEEYQVLRDLPGFNLVYLTAPIRLRYKRALARREKTDELMMAWAEFRRQEKLPTELFIKSLGKKARFKLVNDKKLKDLYQQIEQKIVKELRINNKY